MKPMKPTETTTGPLRRVTATLKRDGERSALFSCAHVLSITRADDINIGDYRNCVACIAHPPTHNAAIIRANSFEELAEAA